MIAGTGSRRTRGGIVVNTVGERFSLCLLCIIVPPDASFEGALCFLGALYSSGDDCKRGVLRKGNKVSKKYRENIKFLQCVIGVHFAS